MGSTEKLLSSEYPPGWCPEELTAPRRDDGVHQHFVLSRGGPHEAPPLLEELW